MYESYETTVLTGTGVQNAKFFTADVPAISRLKGSDISYGDRLIFDFKADEPIHICITDDLNILQPIPILD